MTADFSRTHAAQLANDEEELRTITGQEPRIELINRVLRYLVYLDLPRAGKLLDEQAGLLSDYDLPDERLTYLDHLATLKNQLYKYERAEAALAEALELVKEYGSVSQHINLCIDFAGNLINQSRLDEAEKYLETAAGLLESFPDDELQARVDCRYGALFFKKKIYPKALQSYLQALTVLGSPQRTLSLKGHYFYTLVNTGLGDVYQLTGSKTQAVEAYRRVIDRCEREGLKSRLAWYYLNLGNALLYAGEVATAATYFDRVLQNDTDSSLEARAAALANLGNVYLDEQDFVRAEELFDRAERVYRQINDNDFATLAGLCVNRAKIRATEENYSAAIQQLQLANDYAVKADDVQGLTAIHYFLSEFYAATGDFQSAYLASRTYDEYQQRYHEQLDSEKQRELEVRFQTEAKEKEAERLKLKTVQLQLRALRAQMNPHFLYNCLNAIQGLITDKDTASASKYLSEFALLMRQSMEYTHQEYVSLEDEVGFLTRYLEINCNLRFKGKLDFRIKLDDELEEDIIGIPTMIIQPYVENAIEHGLRGRSGGTIDVAFSWIDDQTIRATITDDGIGRERVAEIKSLDPARASHRSRGTEITLSRLRLQDRMQGIESKRQPVETEDLYAADGSAAGTKVSVIIPVVDLQRVRLS